MARSYHGKILRVDLTQGKISVDQPNALYYRRYMGGWNLIANVLLREVPPNADPLGPHNKLIFAPGILTGLPISGASRNAVGAKSPLTGAFGATEAGGSWGAELKHAGYDAIIVEGASPKPVYLWINDGVAELRDATHLWGKTTKETLETIQEELGDKRIRCTMIGPGGENLVRYACIMNGLKDAYGRTGMGAVMGSKKLKAVAVRGTMPVDGVDADKIRQMARELARGVRDGEISASMHKYGTGVGIAARMIPTGNLPIRNFRDGEFPGAENLNADNFMETIGIGMEGCYACAIRCKKVVRTEAPYEVDSDYGGPEYESFAGLGSCCGIDDIEAVCKANELCNAYSLDTIGTGVTIAFAMECFENGLLTLEDTDGLELRFGNADAMVQAVEKIARRTEGLGQLLAEGSLPAAQRIGGGSESYAMQTKGQDFPMHEPRYKRGLAIGYAVSPTGADHCHSLHDSFFTTPDLDGFLTGPDLRGMGVLEPLVLESLGPEKARACMYHSIAAVTGNCLPVCLFVHWSMPEIVEIVRAATGWDVTAYELLKVGQRALNLARVFNAREGFDIEHDQLPERSYGPTTSGALAEGGIDPEKLREGVQSYYAMMGWDPETGTPRPAVLHELDISWAIEHLPK